MYVPKRESAAHQVAAISDKSFTGCYVYVEGGSDCKFWKNHFDSRNVRIRACCGWKGVVKTLENNLASSNTCIGIIDRDFRNIINYGDNLPNNIFITDDHDIEMMIYHTQAYRRTVNLYDVADHLLNFESTNGEIIDYVMNESNIIGLLKLIDKKEELGLKLKKIRKDESYPEVPKYEKIMDDNCKITSVHDMIVKLVNWSIQHKSQPTKSISEIEGMYNSEDIGNYDKWKLSNGHDVSYIMTVVLHKKIGHKKISPEDFEDNLRSTASTAELQDTELFKKLRIWESIEKVKLFTSN